MHRSPCRLFFRRKSVARQAAGQCSDLTRRCRRVRSLEIFAKIPTRIRHTIAATATLPQIKVSLMRVRARRGPTHRTSRTGGQPVRSAAICPHRNMFMLMIALARQRERAYGCDRLVGRRTDGGGVTLRVARARLLLSLLLLLPKFE